jgi:cysteine-rich repeat protein
VDQFATYPPTEIVVKGHRHTLCAPVDKNGEDPTAPADPEHLHGYGVRMIVTPPGDLRITNQFGTTWLTPTSKFRPDRILVPASKSFGAPTPVPDPANVDHFLCYVGLKRKRRTQLPTLPTVQVEDQFGARTLELRRRPAMLCLPVDKHGEDPTAPTHPSHLLCYRARDEAFNPGNMHVTDQFGSTLLTTGFRPLLFLCVPSLKAIVAEVTDPTCHACVGVVPNGRLEPGEACDDGNTIDCDGCHSDCTLVTGCGDGHLCSGEVCDPPADICPVGLSCDAQTCTCVEGG